MVAALATGAVTAVGINGASAHRAAGTISIAGEDVINQRKGCSGGTDVSGGPVFCEAAGVQTVTAPLRGGGNSLAFDGQFEGITIVGEGYAGRDQLLGGPGPQTLKGGRGPTTSRARGPDVLRGGPDPDSLHGEGGSDDCDGKDGDREVRSCES